MKNALIRHIKYIFEALKINASYFVLDSANDMLPDWLQSVGLTSEFVVYCDATFDKEILQGFIHKDIFKTGDWYYWFEGKIRNDSELQFDNIIFEASPLQPRRTPTPRCCST